MKKVWRSLGQKMVLHRGHVNPAVSTRSTGSQPVHAVNRDCDFIMPPEFQGSLSL